VAGAGEGRHVRDFLVLQHPAGGAGVLRVRLFGPPEARIAQAARIESIDPPVARQRLPEVDTGR
ncbi:MAG TPA: hypothetical protein DEH11_15450, partial [Actinobacteria bacterium]|nr:hypothetical protein [Actinomycetota bacterium]